MNQEIEIPEGHEAKIEGKKVVFVQTERQRRNANGCLSWKKFEDDYSGIPALLVSQALIRRDGKYSIGFDVIGGDEYILIRDIEAAIVQKPAELSEDEKIRNEMIFYFKEEIPLCSIQEHADKMKKFVAWLENKKEQNPIEDVIKNITKNKEAATKFLKSAGIMDDNGELAEIYRSDKKPSGLGEDENNWRAVLEYIKDDALRSWLEKQKEIWRNH